ncbi:prohead protease/major capsid protein fusion protein [Myxococcus sp. Y35]|uniref:prohead protease/major capsid protein fusion protein n=1 Tax=Pseudomyxococcus flavus TaxID=3115648 RepID=UPI003CF93414
MTSTATVERDAHGNEITQRGEGTRKESFTVVPSSINEAARTFEITFATGTPVRRVDWDGEYFEELSLDPKHVRMARFQSGRAPFLLEHNRWDSRAHVGVIERAWLVKGEGRALVRMLKDDPNADSVFNKIRQGVLSSISAGYRVLKMEKTTGGDGTPPTYRVVDWEPMEASAVAMPADPASHIRSTQEKRTMSATNNDSNNDTDVKVRAERERINVITTLMRKHNLPAELEARLINEGVSVHDARNAILDALAERSDRGGPGQTAHVAVGETHDSFDNRVRDMGEALAHRCGVRAKLTERAQQYAQLGLVDMARVCLEARSPGSTRLLSRGQVLQRAMGGLHTISDFGALLGEAGNRVLLDGYGALANDPTSIRRISRQSSAMDFRPKSLLRLGEAPALEKVPESGEVKAGTMASTSTGYALATFAKIFGMTRQAIINDDLGAFDMVRKYGRAAAELEVTQIVGLLTGNKLMDGSTLFSSAHGNLAASGSVISIASLGEGARAMRVQKGLDGVTPLNVRPMFLVVPAALEVLALQVTTQINATQTSNVNPFSGRLEVLVDPRLDIVSAAAWYLAASPEQAPTIEHSYLDGATGPEVIENEGFEVEGRQWKARMDFGCGVISYEGLYKNPGAPLP